MRGKMKPNSVKRVGYTLLFSVVNCFQKESTFCKNLPNNDLFYEYRSVFKERVDFLVDSQKSRLGRYYGYFSHCFHEY